MKRRALKILYVLAWHLGIIRLFYFLNRHRQRILAYHNILPDELFDPDLVHLGVSCPISTFVVQIEALRRRFEVTTEIGKPGICMITFDDGYRNNLLAAEQLTKRQMSGVFFIPAGYFAGETILWVDRLLMWVSYAPAGTYTILDQRIQFDTPGNRRELWARLYRALLNEYANKERLMNELDRLVPLDALREMVGEAMYALRFTGMDIADMDTMMGSGHKLGCHSWHHDILSKLSEKDLAYDFAECGHYKARYDTAYYCYPFGGPDEISATVIAKCKQQGWDAGFTNYPTDSRDRFELGRLSLDGLIDKYFIDARLSGFENFLKKHLP
jgi:peptidoglycan/xylan/chitin deacetylase (PgdA/CDA1 family)